MKERTFLTVTRPINFGGGAAYRPFDRVRMREHHAEGDRLARERRREREREEK